MNLLIPNLGTTSLKYQILELPSETVIARGRLERVTNYPEAIRQIDAGETRIDAVALKAVHAGPRYRGTFLVDDGVVEALRQYLPAAPAHNAIYLTAIEAFQQALPGVPIVAAFEPEFHRTMPEYARQYGVPAPWLDEGVAKYGFHGASHQYVSERVLAMLGREVRLVSCHLGGSSSMCAIDRGKSIDTTMGFSPQSGLENATRHGDLDVFAVLYMMERHGWSTEEVRRQLATGGGLAGLSQVPGGDLRDIEAAAAQGSQPAALALATFAYQVKKTLGAFAAAMGGLDAVAFTGGIGENSARLRSACCEGLEFLGIALDPERNEAAGADRLVSREDSKVAVLALATNEELIVARRAYRCLNTKPTMNDAWVFEHSVECPVAKEFAWAFWTEVSNWKLDADVEAVELNGPFAVGTKGATISRSSGRIEWQIAEITPGTGAVYEIALPGAVCRFRWTFEDLGGRTRMTQRASLSGEGASAFVEGAAALEKGIPAGMKKMCETMAEKSAF